MFLVAADGAVAVHIESGAVRRLPIEPRIKLGIAIDPEHATVARATHEGVDLWALDGVGTGVVASVPSASAGVGFAHLSSDGSTLVSSLSTDRGRRSWYRRHSRPRPGRRRGGWRRPSRRHGTSRRRQHGDSNRSRSGIGGHDAAGRVGSGHRALRRVLAGRTAVFFTDAFAADHRFVAVGWIDDTVDVFDRATRRLLRHLAPPLPAMPLGEMWVYDVEFSPDGRRLIMSTVADGVAVYDTTSWELEMLIEPTSRTNEAAGDGFQHIVFTPDGRFAVTYSSFQGLEIRDPDSLEVLRSVPAESTTNFSGPRPRHQRRRLGDRGRDARRPPLVRLRIAEADRRPLPPREIWTPTGPPRRTPTTSTGWRPTSVTKSWCWTSTPTCGSPTPACWRVAT